MANELSQSYKQGFKEANYDAVVIGSGLGSLTTAWILASKGRRVLVLEKHYTPGGFTHMFKRKNYEWDVGIHYIGEVADERSALARMFHKLSGGQLEWADMGEVYDKICFGSKEYDFVKGVSNWKARLKEYFPAQEQVIDEYVAMVFAVSKSARSYFAEKAVPRPVSFVAGRFMKSGFLKYASRNTLSVLKELGASRELIGVLCGQFGDYGLPPAQSSFAMHAMLVKHYFKGGAYPVGGSSRIFDTIAPAILQAGGAIYTNAGVAEILVSGGKASGVRMEDGREIKAQLIVSGAGVHTTYNRLLGKTDSGGSNLNSFTPNPSTQEKFGGMPASASHLSLYIGLDKTAAELKLPRSNYWLYPEDGYDHDANLSSFLEDPSKPLPLVYISFPSSKDPVFEEKFPGRATIEIITIAPYEQFRKWEATKWGRRGDDYDALKKQLTDRMLKHLYRIQPQTQGHIDHAELSTPLSTKHFAGYRFGEIYGLAHTPSRFGEGSLKPRTNIRGLYLTGQDIVTCGIGGALFSGVITSSAILGKNMMSEMLA